MQQPITKIQRPLFGDKVFDDTAPAPASASATTSPKPAAKPARANGRANRNGQRQAVSIGERWQQLLAETMQAQALDETTIRAIVAESNSASASRCEALEAQIAELTDKLETVNQPRTDHFNVTIGKAKRTIKGKAHAEFAAILRRATARNRKAMHHHILLVGPAGTGKTTIGEQLANCLGYEFSAISLSEGASEAHILGRYLPTGKSGAYQYHESEFVRIYRDGGLFLLDEIDRADANVLVAINAALANNWIILPNGKRVDRHEDSIIVAAGNTYGHGADRTYAGANQLDGATLDRFAVSKFWIDNDEKLERDNARAEVVDRFHAIRAACKANKLRRIVSTRAIFDASDLVDAGETLDHVIACFLRDWTDQERAKLEGIM
jgi:cobaltochelatase CobS